MKGFRFIEEKCKLKAVSLQTIFQLCIPKKNLAIPHFCYQLHIFKTDYNFLSDNMKFSREVQVQYKMQLFSCHNSKQN